jgi:hypothetical protein
MLPPVFATLQASPAVTTVVGSPFTRVFAHGDAPQDTARPYITWHVVVGSPENSLSDLPGIDRCTVQVDCWHATDAGVVGLATAARNAIEPLAHMTGVVVNDRDAATRLFHLAMQFDWWLAR